MVHYTIIAIIILFFFFLLFDRLIVDLRKIKKPYLILLLCLALTLIFKTNYGISFWGLEYEDSFVASFVAREYVSSILPSSFVTEGITIGSLNDPIQLSEYGGHYISYPVFVSFFFKIFGVSPFVIDYINSLIAYIILLVLCLSTYKEESFSWLIAPLVYCIAPIINVFANTHLIETYSSLIALVFLYAVFIKRDNKRDNLLAIVAFILAIITKRDNLALAAIPCLLFASDLLNKRRPLTLGLFNIAITLSVIVLSLFVFRNVISTELTEADSINSNTFSLSYFVRLFPAFIRSMISIKYFSLSIWLCLALIIWLTFKKEFLSGTPLVLLLLFCIYLVLYCSHYRGYFFVVNNDLNSFDTFRYINNFYFLIPLVCGLSIKKLSKALICLFSVLLVYSCFMTFNLRSNYNREECNSRFATPKAIVEYIGNQDDRCVLVTDIPLVYQNIADNDFFICDITELQRISLTQGTTLLCHITDPDYWRKRYGVSLNGYTINTLLSFENGERLVELLIE